jgi:hypothetical protein
VGQPPCDELFTFGERAADRVRERLGALRIRANCGIPAGLVQRRVRGDHTGNPACHRLDDRNPKTLEPRRVREDLRAAIEGRQLLVGDVPAAPIAQRQQLEVVGA